jgi:hypothetical protein|tara:strand:+ start:654 stop:896 length:243 start_codon:yes stop_codon:yes gene_type:complete
MSIKIDRKSGRIILANNETITFDQLLSECEGVMFGMDNTGYCTSCGSENDTEPDSTRGYCENCEKNTVYSVVELLFKIGV